ncbi:17295_t:CDS:2 [Funneliformis caledonium]|uniref:17295_t:CDS:1 n=1 Tax=Funneliformis caledonium TaxID=1117310 RepID=A0A9N9D3R3_9GLOM|nr:17295_t:CDS:2 [Funneliformis caledonium]
MSGISSLSEYFLVLPTIANILLQVCSETLIYDPLNHSFVTQIVY